MQSHIFVSFTIHQFDSDSGGIKLNGINELIEIKVTGAKPRATRVTLLYRMMEWWQISAISSAGGSLCCACVPGVLPLLRFSAMSHQGHCDSDVPGKSAGLKMLA
jgi:hypothetical protein